MSHPRIGGKWDGVPEVFELRISDYIMPITPPRELNLPKFDPNRYYITSGDAIQKTLQLIEEMEELRKPITDMPGEMPTQVRDFVTKLSNAIDAAHRMMTDLAKARGTALFLETEWAQNVLICMPKNPRSRTQKSPIDVPVE